MTDPTRDDVCKWCGKTEAEHDPTRDAEQAVREAIEDALGEMIFGDPAGLVEPPKPVTVPSDAT